MVTWSQAAGDLQEPLSHEKCREKLYYFLKGELGLFEVSELSYSWFSRDNTVYKKFQSIPTSFSVYLVLAWLHQSTFRT